MSTTTQRRTPILLWPFILLWKIVTFVVNLTGILLGLTVGFFLLVLGVFLTSTIIGALIGIPLCILGVMLMARALY